MMDDDRLIEAALFASAEPMDESRLTSLIDGRPVLPVLDRLRQFYAERGVNLFQTGGRWAFRTAPELAPKLAGNATISQKLSRAATETLAIIAYHQPVTRAEIEQIRGVAVHKGVIDTLLEAGWVKPGRRRETLGRPVAWITTPAFLDHFGLGALNDLPDFAELKASGLIDVAPATANLFDRPSVGASVAASEDI